MVGTISAINNKFIDLLLEIARATHDEVVPVFQPRTSYRGRICKVIEDALTKKSESELNEQQLNLLRLCRKIVAVEYRNQYSASVYEPDVSGYNEQTNE